MTFFIGWILKILRLEKARERIREKEQEEIRVEMIELQKKVDELRKEIERRKREKRRVEDVVVKQSTM